MSRRWVSNAFDYPDNPNGKTATEGESEINLMTMGLMKIAKVTIRKKGEENK